ncbi:MAG: hypothetical protein AAB250_10345 [Bdellovibrionota bacterium]
MKTRRLTIAAAAALFTLAGCASTSEDSGQAKSYGPTDTTKVEYDSEQLRMKNSEAVAELVRRKIKKAQDIQAKQEEDDDQGTVAEPEALDQLRDGLRIILARPDQEGARSTVFARLRSELQDLAAFEDVLNELTQEGIGALKDDQAPSRIHATYILILENLMAEIRPDLPRNKKLRGLVEDIRDARLEVSDELTNKQRLRTMTNPVSPSETAKRILPK